ncbi:MAG: arylsulfatase [Verrucomicrobiales bacterium]|nr:arylsulfatase [Verrucomicrobiales bacterium]
MKYFPGILSLLLCFASLNAAEKPNVILFMADDMGMGDTSAYQDFTGNADDVQLATPQMERLAKMGMRFTDAHTPSSRCTPTRYGLLTGRYPWRNRLKYWVLYGSQGDPMIEPDRPTLGSLFQENDYATALVGKWHVGLRYRKTNGDPAAEFLDADLTQPMHTTPLDHGFDFCRFTSRSHGTSGPKPKGKSNTPEQNSGPGHIHGRIVVGATGEGRKLVDDGPNAYVLSKLGGRHSDEAMEFLDLQVQNQKPFFLYYPSNSNHGPYTPDSKINGVAVAGAARTKSGEPMDARHDYIYENDVALGRFLDYLESTDDPRNPGKPLINNTIVIFTSDNGAEKNSDIASGPFRSHKGSVFEGGHRVPFLVAWKDGGIPVQDNATPIGLIDLYATFSGILGTPLPDLRKGEKGGEDSISLVPAFQGKPLEKRPPLFFNDHKEMKKRDNAVAAIRLDDPVVDGKIYTGQWKQFFDPALLREAKAQPFALYELKSDQWETTDRLAETGLQPLVKHLSRLAEDARNTGGIRYLNFAPEKRILYHWKKGISLPDTDLKLTIRGGKDEPFDINERGLGLIGGKYKQVDQGEALLLSFDRDVIVESAGVAAGNGTCGGFYQVGDKAPLAIYCIDADNDAKDQQGLLSDIGVLKKGEILRLDSSPHYGVESPGQWRLQSLAVRPLE